MSTVILVHGAFADSDSWNGVIAPLRADPPGDRLREPPAQHRYDVAPLNDLIRTLDGPIVLVGHSYGGAGSPRSIRRR